MNLNITVNFRKQTVPKRRYLQVRITESSSDREGTSHSKFSIRMREEERFKEKERLERDIKLKRLKERERADDREKE